MASAARLLTPAFGFLCAATFLVYLSFYLLLPVLPVYALRQGIRESAIGLIIGVFALTAMVLKPWVGWTLDWRGRRGLLVAGAVLFAVAALLYPLTRSAPTLLLLRILHGAGMGLFPTAGIAIVADLAPPERRGEAMGVFGMASYVGMVFGPVIGVALDRQLGFLALCLASGGLGWLGVLLATRVPETGRRSDPPSPRLSNLFAAAALRPATVTLALFLAYGSVIAFLPVLVEARQVGNAGVFFACVAVAVLAVRTHSGQLSDRLGRGAVVLPAMATVALALGLLAWAHAPGRLYAAGVLLGLGLGGAQPPLMAWCADLAPSAERGKAMGTFHTAWELGIGAGSILFGLFLPLGGFDALLGAAAAVALGGGLLGLSRSRPARIS